MPFETLTPLHISAVPIRKNLALRFNLRLGKRDLKDALTKTLKQLKRPFDAACSGAGGWQQSVYMTTREAVRDAPPGKRPFGLRCCPDARLAAVLSCVCRCAGRCKVGSASSAQQFVVTASSPVSLIRPVLAQGGVATPRLRALWPPVLPPRCTPDSRGGSHQTLVRIC